MVFAKIADGREQTTCGEQNATGDYVRARAVSSLYGGELLFCHSICHVLLSSFSLVLSTCHIPRHTCPLTWSSHCDALLKIIHIIRCESFVLSSGAVCIFSRTDRSWARLYRVYPKSTTSTAIEYTQEVLCGETATSLFSRASFFVSCTNKKGHLRPVVKIMCPCATPLGTYFPEGNLVL